MRRFVSPFVSVLVVICGLALLGPSPAQASPSTSPELIPFVGNFKITATWGSPSGGYHPASQPAIDTAMPIGTPVYASGKGSISFTAVDARNCNPDTYPGGVSGCVNAGYYGTRVYITHPDGTTSRYLHLSSIAGGISSGVGVSAGQLIAYSGNSGTSTGPHLHYEERNSSGGYQTVDTWSGCNGSSAVTYTNMQNRVGQYINNSGYGCVVGGAADSGRNLAGDGGFEGPGKWSVYPGTSTNFVVYKSGQVSGESARNGQKYGATNTASAGGGIYQDVAVSASPGGLYCASAWVRTQYPATGASGRFVVWLLGGAYNESGTASFTGLSNGANWRQVQTCVAASTAHSVMRIQFYPTPGGKTVDIEDVDVHASIAGDGGFEGPGKWSVYPGTSTNFVVYKSGQVSGESARNGQKYGATNTASAGGGIYQDVAVSASPGGLYCASAWVRTQYPATGASGRFVVWLLGGAYNESGTASFTGLSNGANWRQVQTCVAASTAHSVMRIQFYPTPGGKTVDIEDVDVHASIAGDGGFEGPGKWSVYPGTSTNFVVYKSGQVSGESARNGQKYGATNTASAGGGIYQDVAVSASPGGLYCASAWVRTQYPATGASGRFVVWLLGGAYNESGTASFTGLSNGANWRQVQTCVAASTAHSVMRIQFYPTPGGKTVDIEDVDVH